MSSRCRILLLPLLTVFAAMFASQPAFATITYANSLGTFIDFTNIQETSTLGDPELPTVPTPPDSSCCFGTPTRVGDALYFSPPDFKAGTVDAGGYDPTGAQLQILITAHTGETIDSVNIWEVGDMALSGPNGTGGTGVFAAMSGFLTVLEVNGIGVTPVVISFNAGGANPSGVTAAFTPGALGTLGLNLPGDAATTSWGGLVTVNVASIVANATKLQLSYDNELYAYTELDGNSAAIQKNTVVIGVIPEPGTFALLGGGLLLLAIRARGRRA